jgi:hypothetical protein
MEKWIVYALLALYLGLGYWATGRTIYANKILISGKTGAIFIKKLTMGAILGWLLIPWAIIKTLIGR